jgi:hypothetical protein
MRCQSVCYETYLYFILYICALTLLLLLLLLLLLSLVDRHPGCICEASWAGPHCEYHIADLMNLNKSTHGQISAISQGRDASPIFRVFIVLLVTAVLVVLALVAHKQIQRRRMRNEIATNSSLWQNGFRDRPDDSVNIAPRRQSDFSEIDYRRSMRSSRDPMLARLTRRSVEPVDEDVDDEEENEPKIYIGPPRDEDGHELHNVDII